MNTGAADDWLEGAYEVSWHWPIGMKLKGQSISSTPEHSIAHISGMFSISTTSQCTHLLANVSFHCSNAAGAIKFSNGNFHKNKSVYYMNLCCMIHDLRNNKYAYFCYNQIGQRKPRTITRIVCTIEAEMKFV